MKFRHVPGGLKSVFVTDGRFMGFLPAGKYVVTVTGIGAERYKRPDTSGLQVEVRPGENTINFELRSR